MINNILFPNHFPEILRHLIPNKKIDPKWQVTLFQRLPKLSDRNRPGLEKAIISGSDAKWALPLTLEPKAKTPILGKCFLATPVETTVHCASGQDVPGDDR
ncbi:hypothetical protein [Endozoicomonas sp. SCSIO W0465]|uniref:hypothetical protein n=1 Tax=Endozoicomonas sp. SCSIO W0465 TaxID=2918516 RepID=UPI0020759CFC|nr:hypothetical protein [Endozoicomonas sp. SCSIO W0465]USE39406.1 hypothetical protein MJO57_15315 [Endozoicomonas sp. SCSIO W0465]